MLDCQTPPLFNILNTVSTVDTLWFLRSTISLDLKCTLPNRHCLEEGPAEVMLPMTAQEVLLASGDADTHLYCYHPVCFLHFHNCVVWISHQTGQEQTATDNQGCKDHHRGRSTLHPGTVPVHSQEMEK